MNHIRAAVGLVAVLVVGLASSVFALDEQRGPDPMTASLQALKGKEFESMFLKHMIHHHQTGVAMAELAISNTKRAELNKIGRDIIAAQKAEIEQMTGWLKKDGESAGSMKQMPRMEKMMKEMEDLKKAKDAEFDKMFLTMMIKHHKGAIMMSKLVGGRTDRAELKQLANKIIKDQTKEIGQMKDWEKSWFGSVH